MYFFQKKHTALSFFRLATLLLAIGFFTACNKTDDPGPKHEKIYKSGIYIANEGPFQNGSGTVTYWDKASSLTDQRIFEAANNGEQVGNVLQSIYFPTSTALSDNLRQRVFLVVNNANKVVIADKDTFRKLGEIAGFALPRYFQIISDDKAVVSQWGDDGVSGSVAVVDLKSNRIEKTIPTGSGSEAMVYLGDNRLLVANSGGWGHDSTVVVVNLSSGEVTDRIVLGDNPVSIQEGDAGEFFVICRGHTEDYTDPDNPLNTKGSLYSVKGTNSALLGSLHGAGAGLVRDATDNQLYFLDGGQVYRYDIQSNQIGDQPFVDGFYYSLAFDAGEGNLLASNPKDFASDGEVIAFDRQGQIRRVITAGIVPGYIWVRP